jgi:hypothetical protein
MVTECAGFLHVQMSLRFSHVCTQVRSDSIRIKTIYYTSLIAATQPAGHMRLAHVTAAVRTLPVKYNTQVVYMRMKLRTAF